MTYLLGFPHIHFWGDESTNKKCFILIRRCLVAGKRTHSRGDGTGRTLRISEIEKVATPQEELNLKLENQNQRCFCLCVFGAKYFLLFPAAYIYFLSRSSVLSFSKHTAI